MALQLLLCAFLAVVGAIDNGLGRAPPMGWRSWNLYGANVNLGGITSNLLQTHKHTHTFTYVLG